MITSPCAVTSLDDVAGHLVATLSDGTQVAGAGRSSPPPARTTAGCRSTGSSATRWPASTTPPPSSRPASAPGRRSSSSAAATRPARPPCSWPRRARRSASSCAGRSTRRCRRYLVDRIESHPRVQVHVGTTVTALARRADAASSVTLADADGELDVRCTALFSFIGAEPNSAWLDGVAVDEHGFVLTDRALDRAALGDGLGRARAGDRCRTRRAGPACSPSATSARDRPSASPPPSARARPPSAPSTSTSRSPSTRRLPLRGRRGEVRAASTARQRRARHLTPAVHQHPAARPPDRHSLGVGGSGWGGAAPPVHTPAGRRSRTARLLRRCLAPVPARTGRPDRRGDAPARDRAARATSAGG